MGAEELATAPGESRSDAAGSEGRRFEIEGRSLGFPALFPDASSAVGLFVVSAVAADALIRDSGFEVAEVAPGRAIFSLSCCHYRESDCGVYREIAMAFFVKKQGQGSGIPYLGTWLDIVRDQAVTHIWRLPVTTRLANDAGLLMWGLPKTIEEIGFDVSGGRANFDLRMEGQQVLSYSVRAEGRRSQPRSASAVYSNYEGAPHVVYLEHENRDVGFRIGDGRLRLGGHPVAEQLRGLGLPRRPLLSSWTGQLSLTVGAPQKL
ncbi:MAG: acetoacetate decarboxylase family protein [Deltaproteobacteria bacterium]|nr:acetoacetate decarboxylase family protein [Deltaproteobacteria bacterium]